MKGDVRSLQEEMAGQAAQQETQLQELASDIQALQGSLEAQSAIQSEIVVDTQGGIARELRDMQDQLSVLTQLVGQIQRSLVMLSERIQADGALVTTSPLGADPDSRGAPIGGDGDPARCDENYEAAVTQFNRGQLDSARFGFSTFLGACPDHRQAPAAQFNLGSILEEENRLDAAIEAFLLVGQLSPTSPQVPRALYRIGTIYVLQNNVEAARNYLERVVNTYPDSGVAELARDLLQDIR
jgi:TolA-binding protein